MANVRRSGSGWNDVVSLDPIPRGANVIGADDNRGVKGALNTVWVESLADLPVPVAGVITLPSGEYVFNAQIVNPYTIRAAFGASVRIRGTNILNQPYVYVGGGTAFDCDTFVSTLDISDLLIVDGIGNLATPFNITGASRDNTFMFLYKVIISGFYNCGTYTNIYNLWDLTLFQQFSQGMILNGTRQLESCTFSSPNDVTKDTVCTFDNTTDRVLATGHQMYDNDKIRLKTDGTLPAGLYAGAFDVNGAVIDNGDGTVRLTTTVAHGFNVGDTIFQRKTTNYNGTHIILATPTATTFDITATYMAETLINAEAQLVYYIVNATTDDFQISITIGGTPVNFTDNGTGNHQFYENSICQTFKGTLYSWNFLQQTYNLDDFDNVTAIDFEPTLTAGRAGRGNGLSVLFGNNKPDNVFTGSSLTQKYKYFKFFNTLGNQDSTVSGVIYFDNNVIPTPINTAGVPELIDEVPYTATNLERMYLDGNKLVSDNPDPIILKIFAKAGFTSASAVAKKCVFYIFKNGEEITPVKIGADVLNRVVPFIEFEEVIMNEGDYLELYISNEDNTTNITVTGAKLEV